MYRYVLVHRLTVDYKIIKSNHQWEFSELVFALVFLELRILGILFVEYIPSSTYIYITKNNLSVCVCVCHTLYLRNHLTYNHRRVATSIEKNSRFKKKKTKKKIPIFFLSKPFFFIFKSVNCKSIKHFCDSQREV